MARGRGVIIGRVIALAVDGSPNWRFEHSKTCRVDCWHTNLTEAIANAEARLAKLTRFESNSQALARTQGAC